jgi:DNA topoisomerase VI subunit A
MDAPSASCAASHALVLSMISRGAPSASCWFQKKPWQEEVKRILASGLKYELDALANKDFRYLTKTYLPRKLKEEDWLD